MLKKDIAKSYDYPANSYVVKPLDLKTFTRLMKDLGVYWLAGMHNPRGSEPRCPGMTEGKKWVSPLVQLWICSSFLLNGFFGFTLIV
jgi:hypothetical protein